MVGIDTNILIRFLLADDARQAADARAIITDTAGAGDRIYISCVVLLEAVWVLETVYRFSREELCKLVDALLSRPAFNLQAESAVAEAVDHFRHGKADFADYLAAVFSKKDAGSRLVTFDRACREKDLFDNLARAQR